MLPSDAAQQRGSDMGKPDVFIMANMASASGPGPI